VLASQPSSAAHERIGRYEVLRKIATGGMAELFLAKQVGMEGFERVVAIKRILAHLAYDEEFINMFRDEARIVAKLTHPNIVQIYDLGKAEDTYFIAMEYIPGRNLSSVAKKARAQGEKLPPTYIARCVAQACEGLHYAHTRADMNGRPLKIVHRDVSPQNIIVSFEGTVKLVDFGIAKAATKIAHTRAGVLKGKYAYMSPEQIRGEEVDARSDLFAGGIVLYELLCGRRPFEKENSIQTLKSIVQERHKDCRELNPDIPDALAAIIDRALEKDRNRRFQDAQELQIALEDFVVGAGERVNNLTIKTWVRALFEEELSREQGGTVVFQGIGEVILPESDDPRSNDRSSDEVVAPASSELSAATGSADSNESVAPLPLARGRGGGSIDPRPPIKAPSTMTPQATGARASLIEEGVIDRPVVKREGGYDDDATVMGTESGPPKPSGEAPAPYDDGRTEFAAPYPSGPPSAAASPDGSEDHTLVPGALHAPAVAAAAAAPRPVVLARDESSVELMKPLAQGATDDFAESDDPWDEATVGYPGDGLPPDLSASTAELGVPKAAAKVQAEEAFEHADWGEASSDFEVDATLAGDPEAWEDETAGGGVSAYLDPDDEALDPVVQEPLYDDHDPLEIDLDDDGEPEVQVDATVAVPSISDEIIERHSSMMAPRSALPRPAESSTQGAWGPSGGPEELSDADVEPLDFGEEPSEDLPAPAAEWGGDATIAGAPPLPDVAGLDPDDDLDLTDDPPGFGVEVDFTVRAMDDEPELPVPKSNKDIDQDARTVAGTSSDYLVAGVRPPVGGLYDHEASTRPREPDPDYAAQTPPARRGQEALGAIRLNRVAVSRFSSEEVTEGEVATYEAPLREPSVESDMDFDLPGVQEDLPLDLEDHDDAPPVQPSPLEEPPDEMELPSAAQARDEYSALLAPKLPAPINPMQSSELPAAGPMGIGSTNVPPANLSLSQMLSHPSRASRSKLMAIPRGLSASGGVPGDRSASVLGRQIREVVRDGPGEAPPGAVMPMAQAYAPPVMMPPPPMEPVLMAPPPQGRARRGLLVAALVVMLVLLLGGVGFLAYQTDFGDLGLFNTEPRLTIRTTPPGAEVYVDNALQRGTTPLTISGLKPGTSYTVRLVRQGFEPVSQSVRLPENRPLIWRIPLKPLAPGAAASP
jgi:serine/threonine protein kinase